MAKRIWKNKFVGVVDGDLLLVLDSKKAAEEDLEAYLEVCRPYPKKTEIVQVDVIER